MSFATLLPYGLELYGANKARKAARESAQANIEAAQIAAEAAKFKPYSISTGFGTSFFDENKQEAGYTLDPTLEAFRNAMYGGAVDFMGQIDTDPQAAAQQYYDQQQGIMAGGRGAEDIALRQQQLKSGRIGLGLSGASQGAGAGTGYVNPEQYQRELARAQQDRALAASSTQLAQADIDRAIGRGTGLLQTGLGIEEYGLKPLQTGADIGNRVATAGANQGNMLLAGGQAAANANLAGSLAGAGMFSNFGQSLMKQNFK
jgi:hypothetical protein